MNRLPWHIGAAFCGIVVLLDVYLQHQLTLTALGFAFVGFAFLALPTAGRLTVGPGGAEYEKAVEQVRQDRERTEEAAKIAQVYFSLLAAMAGRYGADGHTIHAMGQRLAQAADEDRPLTPIDVDIADQESWPPVMLDVLDILEKSGIVEATGEHMEVRIRPEFRDAVKKAFGSYLES